MKFGNTVVVFEIPLYQFCVYTNTNKVKRLSNMRIMQEQDDDEYMILNDTILSFAKSDAMCKLFIIFETSRTEHY